MRPSVGPPPSDGDDLPQVQVALVGYSEIEAEAVAPAQKRSASERELAKRS
jgi:hypothetical protein